MCFLLLRIPQWYPIACQIKYSLLSLTYKGLLIVITTSSSSPISHYIYLFYLSASQAGLLSVPYHALNLAASGLLLRLILASSMPFEDGSLSSHTPFVPIKILSL